MFDLIRWPRGMWFWILSHSVDFWQMEAFGFLQTKHQLVSKSSRFGKIAERRNFIQFPWSASVEGYVRVKSFPVYKLWFFFPLTTVELNGFRVISHRKPRTSTWLQKKVLKLVGFPDLICFFQRKLYDLSVGQPLGLKSAKDNDRISRKSCNWSNALLRNAFNTPRLLPCTKLWLMCPKWWWKGSY